MPLAGCLFVVTGACGLVAEQGFQKLLSTVVGASTPAATIVLSVYFAGLTAGGFIFAGLRRVPNPLRLYGFLEGFAGLWLLVAVTFLPALLRASAWMVHLAGEHSLAVFGARLLVATMWIAPPTIAMGMTFPAMVGLVKNQAVGASSSLLVPRFYALNLAGAVAGAFLGCYVLFPSLGLGGGLILVAVLELAVCGAALWQAHRVTAPAGQPSDAGVREPWRAGRQLWGLQAIAFASGFIIFALEVVWTHLIATVIGNSVYAFGIMLTMVLAGLFGGALLSSLVFPGRAAVPSWAVSSVVLVGGLMLGVSHRIWDVAPLAFLRWGEGLSTFAQGELLRAALTTVLVGVPAVPLGMVYPMLFRLKAFPVEGADRAAGLLGAVNAVGCIGGALLAGFVLIPSLGSDYTFRLLVVVLLSGATALAWGWLGSRHETGLAVGVQWFGRVAAPVAITLMLAHASWDVLRLTSGYNVYFRPSHVTPRSSLLFVHEDTFGGFTTVVQSPGPSGGRTGDRTLLTNGKFQGNDGGERLAQTAVAVIPIMHAPRRNRALVIGLGTGHSAAVVAHSGFEAVEIAEIAPGIVEAARREFRTVNRNVLAMANVRLHLEDGRNYLLRTRERYDLVSMEISSVWFDGSTNLYSREFYELVSSRLSEVGVFQQWIQFHHIAAREVVSVVTTVRLAFPNVSVWFVGGQGIIVASRRALVLDPSVLEDLFREPALAAELQALVRRGQLSVADPAARRVLDPRGVDNLVAWAATERVPVNTDRNRFLEYATPRHNLEGRDSVREVLTVLLQGEPAEKREWRLAELLR